MYDLHLSEEQLAIRDTVRDFVTQEITPAAIHPDRLEPFDPPLPVEMIDSAAELGLRGWFGTIIFLLWNDPAAFDYAE